MGSFKAGVVIIGLIIYNLILFALVSSMLSSLIYYEIDGSGVQMSDVGFKTVSEEVNVNSTVDPSESRDVGSFFDTISFITGIGTSSYNLNIPPLISYIVVLLFWIPNLILLSWALYMSLPFIH